MINMNFKLIWLGKIISQLGDKFYAIALAWWILQNTNSSMTMGFFLLATSVPSILFGLVTGALIDRWNRKTILVITDLARGTLVLMISILSQTGRLEVVHVFLVGICLSVATAFFDPAIQAIIPDVVESKDLIKANGLSQMVGGVCQIVGPLCGALAVSSIGMTSVFFVNSISYYVAALLSAFLVWKRVESHSTEKKNTLLQEIREGLCYIKGQKRIVLILIVIGITHFFMGSLFVTLPFFANSLRSNGVNNLGFLEMFIGAGLIAGSIFHGIRKKASADEKLLIKLIIGFGTVLLLIGFMKLFNGNYVILYLPMMLMIGILIASASMFWQLLLQLKVPSNMKGRVFGISSLLGNISMPLAYGIVGILLDIYSISMIMLFSGTGLIILGIVLLFVQLGEVERES